MGPSNTDIRRVDTAIVKQRKLPDVSGDPCSNTRRDRRYLT